MEEELPSRWKIGIDTRGDWRDTSDVVGNRDGGERIAPDTESGFRNRRSTADHVYIHNYEAQST